MYDYDDNICFRKANELRILDSDIFSAFSWPLMKKILVSRINYERHMQISSLRPTVAYRLLHRKIFQHFAASITSIF